MRHKDLYLTLDTETATLPLVNEIAKSAKQKQNIAIAKPLVYDIGWVITDRQGKEINKRNYLVQETFFVPNIFNTAYYKDKRPQYMEKFERGEIKSLPWNDIVKVLLNDLREVKLTCAYNAAFDFKKAIPFTEKYIKALYSPRYNKWEETQRAQCEEIVHGIANNKNKNFLNPVFELRNEEFYIADLWYIACERLINNQRYRDYCLKNNLLTASGTYFKTSAETTFQYLSKQYNFIESHTALDDAIIESVILTKALQKGKIEPTLKAFPFRALGETYKYVSSPKKEKYKEIVINAIDEYLKNVDMETAYSIRLAKIIDMLSTLE